MPLFLPLMKTTFDTSKNFHLPLPSALYAGLRDASVRLGAPATELAREAISAWLKEEKRRRIKADLGAYVDAVAGTLDDHDPAVARAGAEAFLAAHPDDDWSQESLHLDLAGVPRRSTKKQPLKRKTVKR